MRRYFYSDTENIEVGESLKIKDELFKHIFKVCRRKIGDGFELLTKDSSAFFVRVIDLNKNEAIVEIKEKRIIEALPSPHIHLILSNPKPAVFEKVIEKSVELGVYSITPLITENSFFKGASKLKEKSKRLERIALHAQQQTGRGRGLQINEVLSVDSFFAGVAKILSSHGRGYILYEAMSTSLALEDIQAEPGVTDIYIVIGGEGGFNPTEVSAFEEAGFKSISLGRQILRVETACVAGISILKSRWGLWT